MCAESALNLESFSFLKYEIIIWKQANTSKKEKKNRKNYAVFILNLLNYYSSIDWLIIRGKKEFYFVCWWFAVLEEFFSFLFVDDQLVSFQKSWNINGVDELNTAWESHYKIPCWSVECVFRCEVLDDLQMRDYIIDFAFYQNVW